MKTFIETVRKEEVPIGIPTFSEAIKQKEEVEEGFTGKDAVSKSFELLHELQLELQKTEKDLLEGVILEKKLED